jgi:hypothetical protein
VVFEFNLPGNVAVGLKIVFLLECGNECLSEREAYN